MKKTFILLIAGVLTAFMLVGCGVPNLPETIPELEVEKDAETPEVSETEGAEAAEEVVFGMERVGTSGRFEFYRESNTDVIYILHSGTRNIAFDVMTNPETGLPMTYSQYKEFAISNADEVAEKSVEEGVDDANAETIEEKTEGAEETATEAEVETKTEADAEETEKE